MPKGGKREGAGRKPKPEPPAVPDPTNHSGPVTANDRKFAEELLAKVFRRDVDPDTGRAPNEKLEDVPEEIRWWSQLFYHREPRIRFDTAKYWYDKRDGKAIQPVDVDASMGGNLTIIMGGMPRRQPRDAK